jgi:signal transduction histidine kinase
MIGRPTSVGKFAWGTWAVIALIAVAAIVLSIYAGEPGQLPFMIPVVSAAAAFGPIGALIVARRGNAVGWVLLAIGAGVAITMFTIEYALAAVNHPGVLPAWPYVAWAGLVVFLPTAGCVALLLLLFPSGSLPSRRWRPVLWAGTVGILAGTVGGGLNPVRFTASESAKVSFQNPLGVEGLRGAISVVLSVSALLALPAAIFAIVSLVVRYRRGRGDERAQIKWLAFVAVGGASFLLVGEVVSEIVGCVETCGVIVFHAFFILVSLGLPAAIGFAVLKHRLYDIDVVINKTLVYGAMAGFITAVYVAIVVGIGRAIGSDRNIVLSILATALVAVAFQPVRERVQRFANRLVYGKRATPYEVLSEFSGGMSHTVATEELLPRMAQIVAEGSGAARADVWLQVGGELVREASWPEENGYGRSAVPVGADGVTVTDADASIPVRHQGELLGLIGVKKSPGEAVTPAESKLLEDLASQAGLVLRNVRLIEELRTSRQRLVAAQDEERRRLERDLHDGAQQRLVAISLALRMARGMVRPDGDPDLGSRIDQASEQLAQALSELREFARGIHPAILTERGLVPALGSLAERSTVPATVEASVDARLPAPVEATAYFVVSEALANVGKYSKATAVTIRVDASDQLLTVEVADDGVGGADPSGGSGLRGLTDRVAAVDGILEVRSPVGEGTRLTIRLPVRTLARAPA